MYRPAWSAVLFALVALVIVRPTPIAAHARTTLAHDSSLITHHPAAQAPASLDVSVDRDRVTVGDRIAITVVLRLPADAQAQLDGLEQQFGEDLDVLVIGLPEERDLGAGMKEIRVRYEVAAFRTGPARLPALTIAVTRPSMEPLALTAPPIPITVESVLPPGASPDEIRDLKPQIDLPFSPGISRRTLMAIAAGILAAVVIAASGVWLLVRLRRAPPPATPLPAVPVDAAEAAARAELDRISGLGLLESGDLHTFHALLAACVRRYLTERYGFPAVAMTTTELRARMEQLGVGRWQARLATGLLAECDAVAYARYAPARARAETNLSIAYEIVSLAPEAAAPAVPVV